MPTSHMIMALLPTNFLNDVTAALISVSFFTAGSLEKDTENGAAMTSLRIFVRAFSLDQIQILERYFTAFFA